MYLQPIPVPLQRQGSKFLEMKSLAESALEEPAMSAETEQPMSSQTSNAPPKVKRTVKLTDKMKNTDRGDEEVIAADVILAKTAFQSFPPKNFPPNRLSFFLSPRLPNHCFPSFRLHQLVLWVHERKCAHHDYPCT